MHTRFCTLRWELFSGLNQNAPHSEHMEQWLVSHWATYVGQAFAKSPEDTIDELSDLVHSGWTPQVKDICAKRVGRVNLKGTDARALSETEKSRLRELLDPHQSEMPPLH